MDRAHEATETSRDYRRERREAGENKKAAPKPSQGGPVRRARTEKTRAEEQQIHRPRIQPRESWTAFLDPRAMVQCLNRIHRRRGAGRQPGGRHDRGNTEEQRARPNPWRDHHFPHTEQNVERRNCVRHRADQSAGKEIPSCQTDRDSHAPSTAASPRKRARISARLPLTNAGFRSQLRRRTTDASTVL